MATTLQDHSACIEMSNFHKISQSIQWVTNVVLKRTSFIHLFIHLFTERLVTVLPEWQAESFVCCVTLRSVNCSVIWGLKRGETHLILPQMSNNIIAVRSKHQNGSGYFRRILSLLMIFQFLKEKKSVLHGYVTIHFLMFQGLLCLLIKNVDCCHFLSGNIQTIKNVPALPIMLFVHCIC